MGLALQDPSDSDSLDDSYLAHHRHLPGRIPDANPRAKHPRRPFAWSQSKSFARHDRLAFPDLYSCPTHPPRPHHVTLYNANVSRHRQPRCPGPRAASTSWGSHASDISEGCDVARSPDVRLPGEVDYRRPPSLSRQDAFRDARTSRKRSRSTCARDAHLAADDAELYRLGLLYDDEHERGDAFSLDAIVHDVPLWPLQPARAAKRGRKRTAQRPATAKLGNPPVHPHEFRALDLALSFAALGDDEALAAWLLAPDPDELVAAEAKAPDGLATAVRQAGRADLMVIYELLTAAERGCGPYAGSNLDEPHDTVLVSQDTDEWAFLDRDTNTKGQNRDGDEHGHDHDHDNGSDHRYERDTTLSAQHDTDADADTDAWIVLCGDGSKQVRI